MSVVYRVNIFLGHSPMDLTRKRRIYDLNKPEDRVYLLKRGFVWAVIYPHGEKRGKLISAHRDEKGVKFILNYLKDVVTVHTPGPLQRYYDAGGVAV